MITTLTNCSTTEAPAHLRELLRGITPVRLFNLSFLSSMKTCVMHCVFLGLRLELGLVFRVR